MPCVSPVVNATVHGLRRRRGRVWRNTRSFSVTSPVVGADIFTSCHKDSHQVLSGTKSKLSPSPSPAPSNHHQTPRSLPRRTRAWRLAPDHFSGGQKERDRSHQKGHQGTRRKEKNFPFCLQDPVLQPDDWPGSPFRGNADGGSSAL